VLGLGINRAFIFDRGGKRRVGEITPCQVVRWTRARDDISNAVVFTNGTGPGCCDLLAGIEPGRHELVIFRDDDRVWEGPVVRIAFGRDSVEIEARDVWQYAYRTILREKYSNAYPNVVWVQDRANHVFRHSMGYKNTKFGLNVIEHMQVPHTTDTRCARVSLAYQKTLWEEIDDMAARAGLDYTCVGRSVWMYDTNLAIGRVRTMTEADFLGEVSVTVYGQELATYSAVTDGQGRWGDYGGEDNYYGLVEVLNSAFEEGETAEQGSGGGSPNGTEGQSGPSEEAMRDQAKRNMTGHNPTPVTVRVPEGVGLKPETDLTIHDLVPGVMVPLRATMTCRVMEQIQKLDHVQVEQTSAGEMVSIRLVPATSKQIDEQPEP
jgi:hypothetical protein